MVDESDQVRRREFTLLAGATIGGFLSARAQQPAKVHRVGFIAARSPASPGDRRRRLTTRQASARRGEGRRHARRSATCCG